jgi:hypothetical protein
VLNGAGEPGLKIGLSRTHRGILGSMSTSEAPNTRFEYLYRDASNYKVWGSVLFAGPITSKLARRLLRALESFEFFIADQVRVPELFFGLPSWPLEQDDHCWHEFSRIECSTELPNDTHHRTSKNLLSKWNDSRRKVGGSSIRCIAKLAGNHLRLTEKVERHRAFQFPYE